MAQLVLNLVLGRNGSSVTTADNDDSTRLGSRNGSIEGSLCSAGEGLQLKDTGGTVPENSLGFTDSLFVGFDTLGADIKTKPAVRDTFGVGGAANLSISAEFAGGHVVDGQDNFDVVLLGLFDDITDRLAAGFIKEGVTDFDVLKGLLEGESHTTGDDQAVDFGEKVVDELDLVRNLGTSEDSEERALGAFQGLGKVVEFLLDEETGSLLGELNSDHGAVGTVGGSESVIFCILACGQKKRAKASY